MLTPCQQDWTSNCPWLQATPLPSLAFWRWRERLTQAMVQCQNRVNHPDWIRNLPASKIRSWRSSAPRPKRLGLWVQVPWFYMRSPQIFVPFMQGSKTIGGQLSLPMFIFSFLRRARNSYHASYGFIMFYYSSRLFKTLIWCFKGTHRSDLRHPNEVLQLECRQCQSAIECPRSIRFNAFILGTYHSFFGPKTIFSERERRERRKTTTWGIWRLAGRANLRQLQMEEQCWFDIEPSKIFLLSH